METTPYTAQAAADAPPAPVPAPTGVFYPPGMEPTPVVASQPVVDVPGYAAAPAPVSEPYPLAAPVEDAAEQSPYAAVAPPALQPATLPVTNDELLPQPRVVPVYAAPLDFDPLGYPVVPAPHEVPSGEAYDAPAPPPAPEQQAIDLPAPVETVAVAEAVSTLDPAVAEPAAAVVDDVAPAAPEVKPAVVAGLALAAPEAPVAVATLDPLMGLPAAERPMRPDAVGVEVLPEPLAAPPGHGRATTEKQVAEDDFALTEVLGEMLDRGASDLHLTAGAKPMVRLSGSLVPLESYERITPETLHRVLYAALTQSQREKFEENLELDFAYQLPGRARFRVNIYKQRDSLGAAFRVIPFEIKSLESLGVPPVVGNFANLTRGFVLVTGPTGSGKSTTLAAIVDLANRTRNDHIMTVEDPIEFLHKHKSCVVNQREVGEDTWSFNNALKHVLRQDPDIILVGEMRDLETISVALTAAETGHLVFATLHTQDAPQTIDRVIDVFPPHQQQQVRAQLAMALQGVVCQTLAKTADGRGRVVATEVLIVTPAIRNLIREGKTHQIYSVMQAGAAHGMHTLDQHLAELVRTRRITYETGVEKCHHIEDFNRLCGRQ